MLMRRFAIHRVKRLRWPDVFGVNHFDWQVYVRIGKCHMEKETEPSAKAWPILIFHLARESLSLHSLNSNLVMAEVHVVCRLQHQASLIPSVSLSS